MGLFHGSLALSRYRILGLTKKISLSELNEHFVPLQSKKLKLQGSHKEEQTGWTSPLLPMLEELAQHGSWDMSHCQLEDGFQLRMQVERRRLPANLLQLVTKDRLSKEKNKAIKRAERKRLVAETRSELVGLALPAVHFVDIFWDYPNHEVLVFSASKGDCKRFEDLFNRTFCGPLQFMLVKVTPPLFGLSEKEWSSGDAAKDTLSKLSLTVPSLEFIAST